MAERVLVTGASGFTGAHLCRRLVEEGAEVVALVRPTSEVDGLRELGVACREADLLDPGQVADGLGDARAVYHLAAMFRREPADPAAFHRVNVEGTRSVLEAARRAEVERFVHCSTVGVHGHIEDPPADETHPYAPRDPYQVSKVEGERVARAYAEDGLPMTIVRPAGIYGPGDARFLKLFRAIARRRFVMIGPGEALYHMTYVDDLVEGLLLARRRPAAVGEAFILAGPRYTTLEELVERVAEAVGRRPPRLRLPYAPVHALAAACEAVCRPLGIDPPVYARRVEFFELDRAFDISKAKDLLGYEPRVDLADGLSRTAEWYRRNGLL